MCKLLPVFLIITSDESLVTHFSPRLQFLLFLVKGADDISDPSSSEMDDF